MFKQRVSDRSEVRASELVALPVRAGLDHIGALRAFLLQKPDSVLLKPERVADNAWNILKGAAWFKPAPIQEIDWSCVNRLHLIGIDQPGDNNRIVRHLIGKKLEVIVYSRHKPGLPFETVHRLVDTLSLTCFFLGEGELSSPDTSNDDIFLFSAALSESTWLGLASEATPKDQSLLFTLGAMIKRPEVIADAIVPGLRDGQKRLVTEILCRIERISFGSRPAMLSIVKGDGFPEDLEPVLDLVWSRLDPWFLIICLSTAAKTTVWCRSRFREIDLEKSLAPWRPAKLNGWFSFPFRQSSPAQLKKFVFSSLEKRLPAELRVSDLMTASPKCVDIGETVSTALEMMLKFNINALVVTSDGLYVGLINRSDLDRAVQMNITDSPIGRFVPALVPPMSPDLPARIVPNLMARYSVTKLVVAQEDRPVGIVTTREMLAGLSDQVPLPDEFISVSPVVPLPSASSIELTLKRICSIRLFHLLNKIGFHAMESAVRAFAVGGFVRDLLLEKPSYDVDIVVIGDALPFATSLKDHLSAELHVFERFHTVRLSIDKFKIDFSSARIEHYSRPGALPQVEFSGLSNDLFRRDFTLNALALDLAPDRFLTLTDFFGGYRDLVSRKIRTLHSMSFLEDPTRMFRAIRFAVRFGFELASSTRQAFELAIEREAPASLSLKRISAEIFRCLSEPKPHLVLREMITSGLLKFLHPRLADPSITPGRFRIIPAIARRFNFPDHKLCLESIYWSGILFPLSGDEADSLLEGMGMPRGIRKAVVQSVTAFKTVPGEVADINPDDAPGLYRIFSKLVPEVLVSLAVFALDKTGLRKLLFFIGKLRAVKLEITGRDLLEIGVPSGVHFHLIFQKVLEAKLSGLVAARKDELDYAARLFKDICVSKP